MDTADISPGNYAIQSRTTVFIHSFTLSYKTSPTYLYKNLHGYLFLELDKVPSIFLRRVVGIY